MRDGLTLLFPNGLSVLDIIKGLDITETQHGVLHVLVVLVVRGVEALQRGCHILVYQHIGHHTRQAMLQGDGDTAYGSSNLR